MKTYLDCIPCFFRQGLEAARIATKDVEKQKKVLDEIARIVPEFSLSSTPPEMGRIIYKIVREFTNSSDPYMELKNKYNRVALRLYPKLKEKVKEARDPLYTAIKIAIAGNIIDFGVKNMASGGFNDMEEELESTLQQDFAIFDYAEFKNALENVEEILYIADNSGEVVFDRILIEELHRRVIYVVRGGPIINDATMDDALFCKMDEVAKVISSGCDAPGTILRHCSEEFLSYYRQAKMIISKGQGNYETLSEEKKNVFFLLKAKCPIIAKDIGCKLGDIVLKANLKGG